MKFPAKPEVGAVVCYGYLWKREELKGFEDGRKNRPCLIIAAGEKAGKTIAYALPISHTAPFPGVAAFELPAAVKRHLGLDGERSWVFCDEVNIFSWPGIDLVPVRDGLRGQKDKYGIMPPTVFNAIRQKMTEQVQAHALKTVSRSEPPMHSYAAAPEKTQQPPSHTCPRPERPVLTLARRAF